MKIACLDDDEAAAERFLRLCGNKDTVISSAKAFTNKMQLFSFLKKEECNIVFSETVIGSSPLHGIISEIRKLSSVTEVVFLTKYSDYALDAFEAEAMGYILKPCTDDKIKKPSTGI